jgi:hypothetical protein
MTKAMSEYCVYTIKHAKKLGEIARSRGPATFTEQKSWVTASKLWQRAREAGVAMPVLLGDANDCSCLLFRGLLTDLDLRDGATTFTVDCLRPIREKRSPQELILHSSGRAIAPNFIRPYAICVTPAFVRKAGRL